VLILPSGGLGIKTAERGLGLLSSLGTTGTPGKEGKDYNPSFQGGAGGWGLVPQGED